MLVEPEYGAIGLLLYRLDKLTLLAMIVVVYHTKVHLLDRVYIIVDNTMRDTVTRITDTFEDDRSFCGVLGRYISIVVAYSQIGRTFCEPCKVFIHNCG